HRGDARDVRWTPPRARRPGGGQADRHRPDPGRRPRRSACRDPAVRGRGPTGVAELSARSGARRTICAVGLAVISADSHVTQPPDTYVDRIDPKYRDNAPRLEFMGDEVGDLFVIPGLKTPVPMGLVAAAGKPAEGIRATGVRFENLPRGAWDPQPPPARQRPHPRASPSP